MAEKQPRLRKNKSQETQNELPVKTCPHVSPCWAMTGMGLATIVLILDQASKWVVLNHLMIPPQSYPITSFFNIILTWNRGISFGLFASSNPYSVWVLAGIALVFASVLSLWIWRAETKLMALAFGMVLGGAIGNLADRLRFGAVTDFLDFHAYGYHWYTFNLADAAIVGGVALLLLEYVKELCPQNER